MKNLLKEKSVSFGSYKRFS